MAKSGKWFDEISIGLRQYFRIGQKLSYQRIPDKLFHYLYDSMLYLRHGKKITDIGNAFAAMAAFNDKFTQHPLHRGFYYDKPRHALVGTATGVDINVSQGKHHILELNRAIGILEIIRPIYQFEVRAGDIPDRCLCEKVPVQESVCHVQPTALI